MNPELDEAHSLRPAIAGIGDIYNEPAHGEFLSVVGLVFAKILWSQLNRATVGVLAAWSQASA